MPDPREQWYANMLDSAKRLIEIDCDEAIAMRLIRKHQLHLCQHPRQRWAVYQFKEVKELGTESVGVVDDHDTPLDAIRHACMKLGIPWRSDA